MVLYYFITMKTKRNYENKELTFLGFQINYGYTPPVHNTVAGIQSKNLVNLATVLYPNKNGKTI